MFDGRCSMLDVRWSMLFARVLVARVLLARVPACHSWCVLRMFRFGFARHGWTMPLQIVRAFTAEAAGELKCRNGVTNAIGGEEVGWKGTESILTPAALEENVVKTVCSILKYDGKMLEALDRLTVKVRPEEAFEIMRKQKDDPASLYFFQWAANQEAFKHLPEAFVTMIGLLGRRRNFTMAWEMLRSMHCHHYETSYAFSILLHRLGRAKQFKDVAEAMTHTRELNITPTLRLYSLAIQILLAGGCLQEARELYYEMAEAGIRPDSKFYTILLSGIARNGFLDDACILCEEMKAAGMLFGPSIYSLLISLLYKAGRLDKGYELFEMMVENNSFPSFLTDSVVTCALYGERAVKYADMIIEAGKVHSLHIYDRVYRILVLLGKVDQAVELHRRWMPVHKPQHILWREKIEKIATNISSYQILISGLCESGNVISALKLFEEMLNILRKSDAQICNCLLKSLSNAGMLKEATDLCYHIIQYKLAMNSEAQREFFSLFRKSGHLMRSFKLFKTMKRAGCIDRFSKFESIVQLM